MSGKVFFMLAEFRVASLDLTGKTHTRCFLFMDSRTKMSCDF